MAGVGLAGFLSPLPRGVPSGLKSCGIVTPCLLLALGALCCPQSRAGDYLTTDSPETQLLMHRVCRFSGYKCCHRTDFKPPTQRHTEGPCAQSRAAGGSSSHHRASLACYLQGPLSVAVSAEPAESLRAAAL